MNEPLSFLPFAIAAGNGRVDTVPVRTLVAAGLTLLQRSAALVRALSGKRSIILLPPGPAYFVALAASDGRAAVLIDPTTEPSAISQRLAAPDVGAVFTTTNLAVLLDAAVPRVLLDGVPWKAQCVIGGVATLVDLGSHYGLHVEAALDVEPSRDVAVLLPNESGPGEIARSHHDVLSAARQLATVIGLTSRDAVLSCIPPSSPRGLTWSIAPLLVGGWLSTTGRSDTTRITEMLRVLEVTVLVADAEGIEALPPVLEGERPAWGPGLRMVVCTGARAPVAGTLRWFEEMGVAVRMV